MAALQVACQCEQRAPPSAMLAACVPACQHKGICSGKSTNNMHATPVQPGSSPCRCAELLILLHRAYRPPHRHCGAADLERQVSVARPLQRARHVVRQRPFHLQHQRAARAERDGGDGGGAPPPRRLLRHPRGAPHCRQPPPPARRARGLTRCSWQATPSLGTAAWHAAV